jgi:hypothetical protein
LQHVCRNFTPFSLVSFSGKNNRRKKTFFEKIGCMLQNNQRGASFAALTKASTSGKEFACRCRSAVVDQPLSISLFRLVVVDQLLSISCCRSAVVDT